jgi:hypothetical protein
MTMGIGTVFHNWFTGKNNETFELGRALWALGTLAMIAYQGVAIWYKGQPFSPVEFGTGFGAILAAGGVGIAVKDRSLIPAPKVAVETADSVTVQR